MGKLNTYALFIIHIQLLKIFFFYNQLIVDINQRPLKTILVNEVFRGVVDTFALVINVLNESWNPIDVSVGLFEVDETNGKNMVVQFESLLSNFGLMHHAIAFMKDENNNLSTMATALHSIIIYQLLKFNQIYEGTCFGHVMSKACQYYNKVFKGLMQVDANNAQVVLQKTITWTKKSGKGRKNGRRFILNVGCCLENLKPLSKLNLHSKSSCLKRPWNLSKLSSLVMKVKDYCFTTKSSKSPSVAIVEAVISTCVNNLCYESIP
jgi:hypothetical protein